MKKIMKILITLTAFTPLVIFKNNFFPYVFGETFYLRSILVILGVLFIYTFITYKDFKSEILNKLNLMIKNKLFIFLGVFVIFSVLSTVFAIDKYSAFWGTLDRMEGLSALFYFFTLTIFSLFIFEKKDWLNFFRIVLFVTLILFIKEFMQFMGGVYRPQSFVDNPIFLAGYLLFSITSALIVIKDSKNIFWKYFSWATILLSFIGIFITQTRGTILGLFVGIVVSFIYTIFKTRKSKDKEARIYKKLSIVAILIIIIFSGVFLFTRNATLWQKIPGISRVALISLRDSTTNTRLMMNDLSLKAINPETNGVKKFLIGWGPENFSIAYGKYFDKRQFDYEMVWFDRPHNKFFDLFVSLGLLGLLSYILFYFYFIKSSFKSKEFDLQNVAILFFSISFITHLVFVFDQIVTSVPFYLLVGYTVYRNINFENEDKSILSRKWSNAFVGLLFVFIIIIVFIFFKDTLPSYLKSKQYIICTRNHSSECVSKNIDYLLGSNITARTKIMTSILDDYKNKNKDQNTINNIKFTLEKGDSIAENSLYNLKLSINMGVTYSTMGRDLNNKEYLKKGEKYMRQLQEYSSYRPDLNLGLAINLYDQARYSESLIYLDKVMSISPEYYMKNKKGLNSMYMKILMYFYEVKDKENFEKVLESLDDSAYEGNIPVEGMLEFIRKYNTIPKIDVE